MNHKLLTFKCTKTRKKYCFNPMLIVCIYEDRLEEGKIYIHVIGDDTRFNIAYDYDEAVKRWQEMINT